jgi:hypothetical protein
MRDITKTIRGGDRYLNQEECNQGQGFMSICSYINAKSSENVSQLCANILREIYLSRCAQAVSTHSNAKNLELANTACKATETDKSKSNAPMNGIEPKAPET